MKHSFLTALALGALLVPAVAFSDVVPKQNFKEQVPVREQAAAAAKSEVAAPDCVWGARLAPGLANWFLTDEDHEIAPAMYMDVFRSDMPLNFRVGVEGAHITLTQDNAAGWAEWEGKNARITYLRIPFALEYMNAIDDQFTYFVGGGPDLLLSANDNSDQTVGAHLGARLAYNFNDSWGLALEAGYMWARFDAEPASVNLDGAYVTPTLTYTF